MHAHNDPEKTTNKLNGISAIHSQKQKHRHIQTHADIQTIRGEKKKKRNS